MGEEKITLSEATNFIIDLIMRRHQLTRAAARKLLAESLCRNIVVEEVLSMTDFIVDCEMKK